MRSHLRCACQPALCREGGCRSAWRKPRGTCRSYHNSTQVLGAQIGSIVVSVSERTVLVPPLVTGVSVVVKQHRERRPTTSNGLALTPTANQPCLRSHLQ